MVHRSVFGRLLALLLVGGLLFGATSGFYRAGYRQGFAQGAALAATDGQAVTPPAAYGLPGSWGHGPGPFPFAGLMLLGFGAFLLLGAFGRRRRMAMWAGAGGPRHGHPWANDPRRGGPWQGGPWHGHPWHGDPRHGGAWQGHPWPGGQPPTDAGGPIGPEKNPQDYV